MNQGETKLRTAYRIIRLDIASPVKEMFTIGVVTLDPENRLIAWRCGDIRFVADSPANLAAAFEAVREALNTETLSERELQDRGVKYVPN